MGRPRRPANVLQAALRQLHQRVVARDGSARSQANRFHFKAYAIPGGIVDDFSHGGDSRLQGVLFFGSQIQVHVRFGSDGIDGRSPLDGANVQRGARAARKGQRDDG